MQVTTIGLDLTKNLFQVHGVTSEGEIAFDRSLRRAQLLMFFKVCRRVLRASSGPMNFLIGLGWKPHHIELCAPSLLSQ